MHLKSLIEYCGDVCGVPPIAIESYKRDAKTARARRLVVCALWRSTSLTSPQIAEMMGIDQTSVCYMTKHKDNIQPSFVEDLATVCDWMAIRDLGR